MAEREGTPWMEYIWRDPDVKRRFEAGELGYKEARQLDRAAPAAPGAEVVAQPPPEGMETPDVRVIGEDPGTAEVRTDVAPEPTAPPAPPATPAERRRRARAIDAVTRTIGETAKRMPKEPPTASVLPEDRGPPGVPAPRSKLKLPPGLEGQDVQDPRDVAKGPGLWEAFTRGVGSAADAVTAPFSTDWRAGLPERRAATAKPAEAPAAPETPAPQVAEAPAETPATEAPAAAPAGKSSVQVSERVESTGLAPKPKAPSADYPEYKAPAYAEDAIDVELPDGRALRATPTQVQALLATEKAKELNALMDEYRREDDAARSGALWAELVRGVAAIAIAQYGMRHGVNMSAFQLQPIDWTAQQRARRESVEAKVATARDKYKTYEDAAKAASDGQRAAYAASQDAAWREYQAKFGRVEALQRDAQHAIDNAFKDRELSLRSLQIKDEQARAQAKATDVTPAQAALLKEVNSNLEKSALAEAKGDADTAQFHYRAAFGANQLLGKSREAGGQGRPDLAGPRALWYTTPETGVLDRLKAWISGKPSAQAPVLKPSATSYLRERYDAAAEE